MKYTNRADLLIAAGESIKMQEKAGIEPVCKLNNLGIVSCRGKIFDHSCGANWEFPLAVVEGKPVFVGDELYLEDGRKLRAIGNQYSGNVIILDAGQEWRCCPHKDFVSWNPPKPKTVMVELLRVDAEWMVRAYDGCNSKAGSLAEACRKALEKA